MVKNSHLIISIIIAALLTACLVPPAPEGIAVSTLAGSGKIGPLGGGYADGAAHEAQFHEPMGLGFDAAGNLYVSDSMNHRVRMISPDGAVTTVAGGGAPGVRGGLVDGTADEARFFRPEGLTVDAQGNIIVADTLNNRIRRVSPEGIVTTIAGGGTDLTDGDLVDGAAHEAHFNGPTDVAVDAAGNIYVADQLNHVIRVITPNGRVATFAGSGQPGGEDGVGTAASLELPNRLAIDRAGNLYVTEGRFLDFYERTYGFRVRKITPDGVVTTLAGTGEPGYRDGPAQAAEFDVPMGIAVDDAGNVYVVDCGANLIRVIGADGMVSTVAGNGNAGYADGLALAAEFWYPSDIAIGPDGKLYVADWKNHRVRVISVTKSICWRVADGTQI